MSGVIKDRRRIEDRMAAEDRHSEPLHLYRHLDSRVSHLDNRVSALSQDTASIVTKLDGMSGQLDSVVRRVNAPSHTNWIGLIGATVSVIVLMAGFVQMRLVPTEHDVSRNEEAMAAVLQLLNEEAKVVHTNEALRDMHQAKLAKIFDYLDEHDERIRGVEVKAAAAEVSRRAIGDFLRDVDKYGSRRWIEQPRKENVNEP